MTYFISSRTLSQEYRFSISKDDYTKIVANIDLAQRVLAIEEAYYLLKENYRELEECLLKNSLHNMIDNMGEPGKVTEFRRTVIRHLSNFLSSARMYGDHSKRHLGKIPNITLDLEARFQTSYENSFGFRALEEIRNHCQHKGFPAHRSTISASWQQNDQLAVYSSFSVAPDIFRQDKKFKKAVLRELETRGDKVDMTPLIREYVAEINHIHLDLREALSERLDAASIDILAAEKNFSEEFGEDKCAFGLCVSRQESANEQVASVDFWSGIFEVISDIRCQTAPLTNLHKRYITSQHREMLNAKAGRKTNR